MARGIFSILVLSGLCNFASSSNRRQYHFINEPKTWPEAQRYCRETHTDLATVNDVQDLEELAGLIRSGNPFVFLGLYRGWGWSLSDADDYKEGEPAYWNWARGQNLTHYCGIIGSTGEWSASDCSSSLNFFCYDASTTDVPRRFTLGKGSMNWLDAQAYCRGLHTDLARVRNRLENEQLQSIVNNGSAWIGLTRRSLKWSDGSEPSFTPWKTSETLLYGDCGVLDVNSKPLGITNGNCDEKVAFFCYSGPLRKHLVRLKLRAGDSSVDVNDPAVMESVSKWVEENLRGKGASEGVKLSWWKLAEKEKSTKQEQTKTHKVVCAQ